jgi:hypothetical protein
MNAASTSLSHHPAPLRGQVPKVLLAVCVAAGPLAWFVQLCAGYGLASWACFPHDARRALPLSGWNWTFPAMVALLVLGVIVALAALLVSWRTLERTREEAEGGHHHLMEIGAGRTRFLALWGTVFSAGFAIATLLTVVAFIVVPRCAG